MEPDVSMETECMIRVAVIPVGGAIPQAQLRGYVSMLVRHRRVDLSSISSFYSEHQKSPFANQPWDTGSLRFKFIVGGSPPSPWEDFQSNRKILAVVGLCHCPSSPDLAAVGEQFAIVCKGYGSAVAQKCFAFCPSDSQLEEGNRKVENLVLFPPSDRQSQELHMLTMVQDLAASLLMEFEKWVLQAESAGTILKTPLDSQASLSSEEVIKAKKKRLGRAQKTIGDYCLLAGSPLDANAHYATAIELARLTGDIFWHAGALEGSACALLLDQADNQDPSVEEEVKYRYYNVIQLYRRSYLQDNAQRVSTVTFELEAALKLARYLCRRGLVKEVVELLMGAADGGKSLIDANDRLILFVEVARLFASIGYQRKAAFFSRQVAQLYLQQDTVWAATSAMKVLSMTSKGYHIQSKGGTTASCISSNGSASTYNDGGYLHAQSIVSLFESQWSTLQMVVLREILLSSVRAGDPLAAWSAAARLLRSYYPLITPSGQNGLASSLSSSSERLPSGTRCADPALPFIRLHSFPVNPSQMDIIKRDPGKEGWWMGSAPTGPFIYTPFSKGGPNDNIKQELTWIVGEPVQVLVELANPCGFDLFVDSIYLSVPSGNFDAFPVSVHLPPTTAKIVTLSGIPTKVGPVTIPGCIVHCFGVITEHLFKDVDNLLLGASQGLVLSDPFRSCGSGKLRNMSIPNVSVVPPLPLLVAHVVGGDGTSILYEGEIRDICISFTNAGTVSLEQAYISLSGRNQDSVISVADDILKSTLPLKPGMEITLPVTLKAWKLSASDLDPTFGKNTSLSTGRMSREGSSPLLVIHYAGPLTYTDNSQTGDIFTPGRRLIFPLNVRVSQGLRFVNARLLSMEIPAHISDTLPKPTNLDQTSSEEINCAAQPERLVKIDPYKGSWGLRLLELELSNPTDVSFEVNVCVQFESSTNGGSTITNDSVSNLKTRIDRDCSARVLIPLEHFKLPVIDGSFFMKDPNADVRVSSTTERSSKTEVNALINSIISKIKVKWQSGRNSSGELNIKDAIQAALQTSVMDVLLPDPLTFGFRLSKNDLPTDSDESKLQDDTSDETFMHSAARLNIKSKGSIPAHAMTNVEALIRNNTKETIKMSLNISCRDIAGENCIEGKQATVLWAGVLNGIELEVSPLQEIIHTFSLYFLVPGDYTLQGAAVIFDATDILRFRAKTTSEEPIFCRGSPFHVHVVGTA